MFFENVWEPWVSVTLLCTLKWVLFFINILNCNDRLIFSNMASSLVRRVALSGNRTIKDLCVNVVAPCPKLPIVTSNGGDHYNDSRTAKRWSWKCFTLGGLFVAYCVKAKRHHVARAAEGDPHSMSAGSGGVRSGASRRGIYNFIADVVQKSSPAVVHLERMGK